MTKKVFAVSLLAVSWLSSVFMLFAMVTSHWSPLRLSEEVLRTYFGIRSRYALIVYAFSLLLAQTIGRLVNLSFGLWEAHHKQGVAAGSHSLHHALYEISSALTVSCIGSTILFRSWRLRVRHMYYVVLKNSGWSQLMDASVVDSLSLWIKYKAILTSDVSIIALVLVYISAIGCFVGYYRGRHHITKAFNVIATSICVGLTLLCLVRLPKRPDLLKQELLLTIHFVMFSGIIDSVLLYSLQNWRTYFCISQSLSVFMVSAMCYVSFYWFPRLYARREENAGADSKQPTDSRRLFGQLESVMCDAQKLTQFMEYCCERYCAENLLALLEIREFKLLVREMLVSNSPRSRSANATDLNDDTTSFEFVASSKLTRSLSFRKPALEEGHSAFFATAQQTDSRRLRILGKEWTRWDLSFSVKLSQLGCRSSIVSGSGDLHSKALALCNKYFEWDSELGLNVSFENRTKVLGLVGKNSTANLLPVELLFAFDESIFDVFANLRDSINSFERIAKRQ